jgi:dUTPase
MRELFIYNEFGITPTKNYTAAGYDFYVPNIVESNENRESILKEFMKSYKIDTMEEIERIYNQLSLYVSSNNHDSKVDMFDNDKSLNILHLYLASCQFKNYTEASIIRFVDNKLIFDKNNVPGIKVEQGDYLLINSGIRTKLPEDTAGIFFNKSGKGNQGFDIRACVVDEDYSGLVHMSCAYDKSHTTNIYCGDKLTQFVVLPLVKTQIETVDKDTFFKMHENSLRGSDGFGSSDVKR